MAGRKFETPLLHATPLVSDLGLDAGSRRSKLVLFPARQLNVHDGTLVPSWNIRVAVARRPL